MVFNIKDIVEHVDSAHINKETRPALERDRNISYEKRIKGIVRELTFVKNLFTGNPRSESEFNTLYNDSLSILGRLETLVLEHSSDPDEQEAFFLKELNMIEKNIALAVAHARVTNVELAESLSADALSDDDSKDDTEIEEFDMDDLGNVNDEMDEDVDAPSSLSPVVHEDGFKITRAVDLVRMTPEQFATWDYDSFDKNIIPYTEEERKVLGKIKQLSDLTTYLSRNGERTTLRKVNKALDILQEFKANTGQVIIEDGKTYYARPLPGKKGFFDIEIDENTGDLLSPENFYNKELDETVFEATKSLIKADEKRLKKDLSFVTEFGFLRMQGRIFDAGSYVGDITDDMNEHFNEYLHKDVSLSEYNDKHLFEVKQLNGRLSEYLRLEVIPVYEEDLLETVKYMPDVDYKKLRKQIREQAELEGVDLLGMRISEVQQLVNMNVRKELSLLEQMIDKSLATMKSPELLSIRQNYFVKAQTITGKMLGSEYKFGSLPELLDTEKGQDLIPKLRELYEELNVDRFSIALYSEVANEINELLEVANNIPNEVDRDEVQQLIKGHLAMYVSSGTGFVRTADGKFEPTFTYKNFQQRDESQESIDLRLKGMRELIADVYDDIDSREGNPADATLEGIITEHENDTVRMYEKIKENGFDISDTENIELYRELLVEHVRSFLSDVYLVTQDNALVAEYENAVLNKVNDLRGLKRSPQELTHAELFGSRGIGVMTQVQLGMLTDFIDFNRIEFNKMHVGIDKVSQKIEELKEKVLFRLRPIYPDPNSPQLQAALDYIENHLEIDIKNAETVEDYMGILDTFYKTYVKGLEEMVFDQEHLQRRTQKLNNYVKANNRYEDAIAKYRHVVEFQKQKQIEAGKLEEQIKALTERSLSRGRIGSMADRLRRGPSIEELTQKLEELNAKRHDLELRRESYHQEVSLLLGHRKDAFDVALRAGVIFEDGTVRDGSASNDVQKRDLFAGQSIDQHITLLQEEQNKLAELYEQYVSAPTAALRDSFAFKMEQQGGVYKKHFVEAAAGLRGEALETKLFGTQKDYADIQAQLAKHEVSSRGFIAGALSGIKRLSGANHEYDSLKRRSEMIRFEYNTLRSQYILEHAQGRLDKAIDVEENFFKEILARKKKFEVQDRNVIEKIGSSLFKVWDSLQVANPIELGKSLGFTWAKDLSKSSMKYKVLESLSLRNVMTLGLGLGLGPGFIGGSGVALGKIAYIGSILNGAIAGIGTYSIANDFSRWKIYKKIPPHTLKNMSNTEVMAELNKRVAIATVHNVDQNEVPAIRILLKELYTQERLFDYVDEHGYKKDMLIEALADRYLSPQELRQLSRKLDEFNADAIEDFEKKLKGAKEADNIRKLTGLLAFATVSSGAGKWLMTKLFNDSTIGKFLNGVFSIDGTNTAGQAAQQAVNQGVTPKLGVLPSK